MKTEKLKQDTAFANAETYIPNNLECNVSIDKVSREGRMADYTMFLLLDCVESLYMISEKEANKAGLGFKPREKTLLNTIKYAVKDLLKVRRSISEQSQYDFGEDADELIKLIMLTIDRAGTNNAKMKMIINFIDSINSEMNLNLKKFGI